MAENDRLARIDRRSPEPYGYVPRPVVGSEVETSDTYFYLRTYRHILFKRRWSVLTVAFVLTTLMAIISFKMRPVYEATARVEVEAETPPVQSLTDLDRAMPTDQAFVETQVKVLQSDNLFWRVIQQLRLGENPAFGAPPKTDEGQPAESAAATQNRLINVFRDHLRVERARDTRLIEVRYQSTDPQLAAQAANALVNNYTEYNFRKKYDATRQASGWMEQQLDELKAKVEKSQQALVDYERQNGIVNISDKQSVIEQRLADLSKGLTDAQGDRVRKESLYDLVRSNEAQVAFIAQSELLQRLEEKHADLNGQYIDAVGQYGPNFPTVIRLRAQVNEIQSLIDRERKRIVARIRNDYLAARGREKLLSAAVARETLELGKLNQLLIQHNILKREFETNQQLYENLLQRLKDATVSAGLRATNIHVIDLAFPPTVPVRPKKLRNIAIGLVVGLILGVTLACVQEGIDSSVRSSEELERVASVPTLAVIPAAGSIGGRSSRLAIRNRRKSTADGRLELLVMTKPASALAESYRALRTSILLSAALGPPRVLLVTSAQPNEGKSCTSLNLALAFAQRGSRVLVIDADLRNPAIGRTLCIPGGKGLSSFLAGNNGVEADLRQFEALANLWVLPAGPCPPNPAELLSSPVMEELLCELRKRFDHILLDSPPVLMVTDAIVLSPLVDGVMLVVESGATPRGAVARARRMLENAGAKVLGTVLNKLDLRHDGYYGTYYHHYRRYYREDPAGPSSAATISGNNQPDSHSLRGKQT